MVCGGDGRGREGGMMTLYHGGRALVVHDGLCLADSEYAAEDYASGRGEVVTSIELPYHLAVREVEVSREDRDNMDYPGDRPADRRMLESEGVDVIVYDDETPTGRQHRTYRLVSDRAVRTVAAIVGAR